MYEGTRLIVILIIIHPCGKEEEARLDTKEDMGQTSNSTEGNN